MDEPGLRERKKEKTRADLRACAARLFTAHGFDGTTIADIAACANVSERTFFRYFDSKEALLLPDSVDLFALIEAELAARPADEEPFAAVRAAVLAAAKPFAATSLTALTHSRPDEQTAAAALLARGFFDFEHRLTGLVRDRLPADEPNADLRAAVIAGAALSAARAALRTRRARRADENEAHENDATRPRPAGPRRREEAGENEATDGETGVEAGAAEAVNLLNLALDMIARLDG